MTLPDERYRAITWAENFLQQLASGEIPRVPKTVREEARRVLRHYPGAHDLWQLERAAPHVIQRQMEPLHKWILSNDSNAVNPTAQQQLHGDDHEGSTQD